MKTYRILYFGTWGYGKAGLEALLGLPQADIVKVFSKWDLASANPYLNQVYQLAAGNGLPLEDTERRRMPKEAFRKAVLEAGEVDFILSCCYDRFFPAHIRAFPGMGALNLHPSLLPAYRGIKPLENALANGETTIGVTLHELTRELDAGDIILQKAASITRDHTFGQVYDLQCELIKSCLAEFFAGPETFMANKAPQDHSRQSDAPRLPFDISDGDTMLEVMQKMKACIAAAKPKNLPVRLERAATFTLTNGRAEKPGKT